MIPSSGAGSTMEPFIDIYTVHSTRQPPEKGITIGGRGEVALSICNQRDKAAEPVLNGSFREGRGTIRNEKRTMYDEINSLRK